MRKFSIATASFLAATFAGLLSVSAGEKQFFNGIQGSWKGPGEIVAGKYKGTKFTCSLKGVSDKPSVGMEVNGTCRIGVFTQPMSAKIHKQGKSYSGRFLDGEKGEGMDVTGGRFTSSRLVVGIKRKQLNATMVARLDKKNKLNVTVSVKVQGKLIPVIGMSLNKITRTSMLK